MLRITILNVGSTARLLVEGKLAERWVSELRRCWEATGAERRKLVVDLTGVTLVDLQGKAALAEMYLAGAQMEAKGLMTQAIIEEIQKVHQ